MKLARRDKLVKTIFEDTDADVLNANERDTGGDEIGSL